jgi:hypothetical protein
MNMESTEEQRVAIERAEIALSRASRGVATLSDVTALSDAGRRNLILRALLRVEGGAPRTVIIKATRSKSYDPTASNAFESGLVKEWTATAFLTERTATKGHAPTFLAGDIERGLVVLEDLGADLGSLVSPLLEGSAATAEHALLSYATSLGLMHADTLACIDGHAEILRRTFPAATITPPVGGERWRREVAGKVLDLLGDHPPDEEIDAIAQLMSEPGRWLGLAHRDLCPDNVLLSDGRARLIDFEFAGPGHMLLDASYWRLGFPTCWCAGRVPPSVLHAMDLAYLSALGPSLPAARDSTAFRAEMASLLFVRMFASLSWLLEKALKEDTVWGISTHRARLLWHVEAAIAGSDASDTLPGLHAAALRWRADLGARWPETQPLALYPAFAAQGLSA